VLKAEERERDVRVRIIPAKLGAASIYNTKLNLRLLGSYSKTYSCDPSNPGTFPFSSSSRTVLGLCDFQDILVPGRFMLSLVTGVF
jgi:hypothetical protein